MITNQNVEPGKPARVVLIGAYGFIGKAVRAQIEAHGIQVVAPSSSDINLLEVSAAEKLSALIKPADAVVMLSVLAPDRGRDAGTLMKNLAMMQNLCTALGKTSCSHLIYFSSDAVYNSEVSRIADDTPSDPQDLYGAMHLTREIMARDLATAPLLVLRPTLVYGHEDTHNAYGPNRFRRTAQKDSRITLFGGGEEMRDHIHVDDVAALTVRCLLYRSTGMLTVASGVSISFQEVAALVAKQFCREIEIAQTPRKNPVIHRHYDVTSLIKAFPDFRFVMPAEGIQRVHKQMVEAT